MKTLKTPDGAISEQQQDGSYKCTKGAISAGEMLIAGEINLKQYAQPQGNTMDIKKLIPISYVKKFTPLVVGDVVMSDNRERVITGGSESLLATWNSEISDKDWRLVSFADRPNTGVQPVGDDVYIDTSFADDDDDGPTLAKNYSWNLSQGAGYVALTTWKPSHSAMLKQYQAEQVNKEQAHHVALQTKEPGDAPKSLDVVINPDVTDADVVDTKTVLTQAMADAGELPPLNVIVQMRRNYGNDNEFYNGKLKHSSGHVVWFCDDKYGDELHPRHNIEFKPTQTDEEKLRDAINELWDAAPDKWATIEDILNNDKFEIKLKG